MNSFISGLLVVVLSIAAMAFVTAELLPIGILYEIGSTYNLPVGTVGLIVTGYAMVMVIAAIFLTPLLHNLDRKKLLVLLLLVFSFSNLIVAWAPSLLILYIGRVIGACCNGIFWSIAGLLAIRLVPEADKTRAISIMLGGSSIAGVVVIPVATYFAQIYSWRVCFFTLGLISFLIMWVVIFLMPRLPQNHLTKTAKVSLLKLAFQPYLRRLFVITALILCGHFCGYTFIGPILEDNVGISHEQLPTYLLCFGAAGIVGNALAGFIRDAKLVAAIKLILLFSIISIVGLAYFSGGVFWLAYMLVGMWGICIYIVTITLQSLTIALATDTAENAMVIHVAVYNGGIALGALIGGLLINNFSSEVIALFSGILLVISIVMLIPSLRTVDNRSINQ